MLDNVCLCIFLFSCTQNIEDEINSLKTELTKKCTELAEATDKLTELKNQASNSYSVGVTVMEDSVSYDHPVEATPNKAVSYFPKSRVRKDD